MMATIQVEKDTIYRWVDYGVANIITRTEKAIDERARLMCREATKRAWIFKKVARYNSVEEALAAMKVADPDDFWGRPLYDWIWERPKNEIRWLKELRVMASRAEGLITLTKEDYDRIYSHYKGI
jgi:hypothetical protein